MSYIIKKYKDNEIKIQGLVAGWYYQHSDEFYPLRPENIMELYLEGLVDIDIVIETVQAYKKHQMAMINKRVQESFLENDADNYYEMDSAFGIDSNMDLLSGEIINVGDY